jgi:branched-chain amino acid transport system substrate-binding protein
MVEVKGGKQEVIAMVPPLNAANVNAKLPVAAKK